MSCARWPELLDLHLDGELAGDDLPALEAHLASCASCTAEALRRREIRDATREVGLRFAPSEALRGRVVADVAGIAKRRASRAPTVAAIASLAAAAALAGFALALVVLRHGGGAPVAGELLDVHVATLASAFPVDVVSQDTHTVKPWFAGRLPFSFDLPDPKDGTFTLEGGRVAWLEGAPAAQLLYRVRKHLVSVFVAPEETPLGRAMADAASPERRRAFRLMSWSAEGLRFVAVTDAARGDLENLAALFRGAAAR